MTERSPRTRGIGQISTGIQPGTVVAKTIEFVRQQLPRWRDDSTRPVEHAEPKLNIHMCMFLEARARTEFPTACFHHEVPEPAQHPFNIPTSPPETISLNPP